MRIAILGGGIGGLSLAWHFLRLERDLEVTLFERDAETGGLVKGFSLEGRTFDRHYHVVLVSDEHLRDLVRDLNLEAHLRFKVSRMGFYDGAQIYPFDNPLDLLRFPPLSLLERLRLAATVLYCQQLGDPQALHEELLEPWLKRLGGDAAFEKVWRPLLCSKFDGSFDGIPATYLWSRMRRMGSTREKAGAVETLGILHGGSGLLVRSLTQALPSLGATLKTGAEVQGLLREGRQFSVVTQEGPRGPFDLLVSTLPTSLHDRISGPDGPMARSRLPDAYLGIVDVVLALKRSLSPYYTLNLLDNRLPFTGVIETTNLMNREDHGDIHLVYLPRYTDAGGPMYRQSDASILELFLSHLFRIFPLLRRDDIIQARVFKEPFVEPIHKVGGVLEAFPDTLSTRWPGVYLMNTGRLYPKLHNCQAVIELAHKTASWLLERHA